MRRKFSTPTQFQRNIGSHVPSSICSAQFAAIAQWELAQYSAQSPPSDGSNRFAGNFRWPSRRWCPRCSIDSSACKWCLRVSPFRCKFTEKKIQYSPSESQITHQSVGIHTKCLAFLWCIIRPVIWAIKVDFPRSKARSAMIGKPAIDLPLRPSSASPFHSSASASQARVTLNTVANVRLIKVSLHALAIN